MHPDCNQTAPRPQKSAVVCTRVQAQANLTNTDASPSTPQPPECKQRQNWTTSTNNFHNFQVSKPLLLFSLWWCYQKILKIYILTAFNLKNLHLVLACGSVNAQTCTQRAQDDPCAQLSAHICTWAYALLFTHCK